MSCFLLGNKQKEIKGVGDKAQLFSFVTDPFNSSECATTVRLRSRAGNQLMQTVDARKCI
jgi:hypothetical protein